MNGYDTRGDYDGTASQAPRPVHEPRGPALIDAYKQDGFGRLNSDQPNGLGLLDLKDNVQVHLLAETAIFDSKGYEILSQDEVDELKKQGQLLNQRMENVRSDLAVQSKYRDAAMSMSKLYTPGQDTPEAQEAEAELSEINHRCEGLAAELWSLERRSIESQKRLLEHTAGILQHTHKTKKNNPKVPLVNGVPASPESMHTTSNSRNSFESPDDFVFFSEGSLYQSFDQMDTLGSNTIDIPLKSPNRDQQKQMNEENDKLRHDLETQYQVISDTERRLESFNHQLRDIIVKSDPSFAPPPSGEVDPSAMLHMHLDYLEHGLGELMQSGVGQKSTGDAGDFDTVIPDLWETIQSGYANVREQKQERRRAREEKGQEIDEADMSDNEFDLEESYSLHAFSSKVQWLFAQATSLQHQKGVLKRQIKQQRELNSRSDSEKDEAIQNKIDELEESRALLHRSEKEHNEARAELSQALEDLNRMQADFNNMQGNRSEESAAIEEAHGILKERNARLRTLEAEYKEMQARLEAANNQLEEANNSREDAEQEVEEKEKILEKKQGELDQLSGMVAELKMESAMAKAELDGAYGSRSERAAEAAALYDTSESTKLESRQKQLEDELKNTAKELAEVVQTSLESEKKIGDLEDQQDRLQGDITRLRKEKEQLHDELDNERLKANTSGPNGPLSPGGSRGTTHLTESYRNGLRAERKKYDEQLKAEQLARRKVEEELRALRRAQGPGKSPLSPR